MSVIHPGHLDAEGLNWGNWSCSSAPPYVRLCDLTPFYHFSKHLPSAEESSPLFFSTAAPLNSQLASISATLEATQREREGSQ